MFKNKIEHEEFCKKIFHDYLKTKIPDTNIEWEKYPRGKCKSPDFYMYVDGHKYIVEVTSIHQDVASNINTRNYEKTWESIIQEVNREIEKNKDVENSFIVTPRPVIGIDRKKREIIKKLILNFTKEIKERNSDYLQVKYKIYGKIRKAGKTTKPKVVLSFAYGKWKNDPQLKEEIYNKINNSIEEKIKKLSDIDKPWILIINDAHPFSNKEIYKDLKKKLKKLDMFYLIFLISYWCPNGFLLHVKNSSLLK